LKFNLKDFLKSLKTNESTISMALGALVIIVVGILTVNYFRDRNAGSLGDGLSTGVAKEHVVAAGESLWSVSEDYYGSGYNWVDLANANGLTDYSLEVGQTLTLPEVTVKEPTATKTQVSEVTTQTVTGETYTVVKGDSLWDIAVRAYGDGYKWVEIAKVNGLTNPNVIHTGNVLSLPR
jgi:nucleoid-associated protein YgaU